MDSAENDKLHQSSAEPDKLHNEPQILQEPENQPNKPTQKDDEDIFSQASWCTCGIAIMVFYVLFHFLNDYISSLAGFNVSFLYVGFIFIFFIISANINKNNWACIFFSMACANALLLFSAWVQQ